MTKRPTFIAHREAALGRRPGDRVTVGGFECVVADERMAEQAECVVCIPALPRLKFPDNEVGLCAGSCGQMLQWRPHAPKKPPRLCAGCAGLNFDGEGA